MKTYAEARDEIIWTLRYTSPGGEGPNGEVIGAITVPFEPLTQEEIDAIIKAAAEDSIVAEWESYLNQQKEFTNISFELIEAANAVR